MHKNLSTKVEKIIKEYGKSLDHYNESIAYILVRQTEAKCGFARITKYLKNEKTIHLKEQIEKIDELWKNLKKYSNKYPERLIKELDSALNRYEVYVRFLNSNEPEELDDMLSSRDVIEIILRELEKENVDITEYKERVKKIDDLLKDGMPKWYRVNQSPPPFTPKDFWWWSLNC